MERRKIIKAGILIAVVGIVVMGAVGLYLLNMPHRNVQKANADYSLSSSQIVTEYLTDKESANKKYLAEDGDSKILKVSGIVSKISEDFIGQKVVLLKGVDDKAGVSASFTKESNSNADKLKVGQTATLKGVIRSGASYDKDLDLYENVILEKSNVATK
ncbi:MAG: hypothetical protein NTZ69_10430 [Bacteroidia bacterium]|nr:hypothetical protein [Bacteroidia bacterium]